MAVYLFTFHAYRSWNADRAQGFVLRHRGVQPPNRPLAQQYDRRASHVKVVFTERHQRAMVAIAWDACERRCWKLHCVATEPSHLHLLVSWREFQSWQPVRAKLKNLLAWSLGKEFQVTDRKWLVGGGSRKQVQKRSHFDHLMQVYLPSHRGVLWREGDAPPAMPDWVRGEKGEN